MKINIVTLFPEYFESVLASSILQRAQTKELVTFNLVNARDFTSDKHHTTDDRPYGGGPGMLMMVEPIARALQSLGLVNDEFKKVNDPTVSLIILTSAKGRVFTQPMARDFSELQELTIICGHYEGVDERVAEHLVDAEVRIGDYVLTGGEPAGAVMVDAVARLIPGVLGNEASPSDESHTVLGQLGFPQYTRPEEFNGWVVPPVLLGGNHMNIQDWKESKKRRI